MYTIEQVKTAHRNLPLACRKQQLEKLKQGEHVRTKGLGFRF